MLKRVLLASVVGGLMATGALAQDKVQDKAVGAADPSQAKFISSQTEDQWVFSKFKGSNVLGPNDEHIGDVSDLLFDKSGKIYGVIVGVGGFLGIGQKNVAIDMGAFQVMPASTGSSTSSSSNDPTDVKLKVSWTKDQLQAAPDFKYFKAPASTVGSGGPTGMGQRPNPATPSPRAQ
jgi:hypothetical protein